MHITLKILPGERVGVFPKGVSLRYALESLGEEFSLPCMGEGVCGGCRVRFLKGAPPPTDAERRLLTEKELKRGVRLICQAVLREDAVIQMFSFDLPLSGDLVLDIDFPKDFPEICDSNKIFCAVDLGTTSVQVLLDESGEREFFSFVNPQVKYGLDVISRAKAFLEGKPLREELFKALKKQLKKKPCLICFSGNPVMQGIVKGEDLTSLVRFPFDKGKKDAVRLCLGLSEKGEWVLPEAGGFLGGDAVSMSVAASILEEEEFLCVDIGTNTEVVVHDGKKFLGASCPAGSALEGYGISCGTLFSKNAIFEVREDLTFLSEEKPEGICGTGLISLIWALRRNGLLDAVGRLVEDPFRLTEGIFITQSDVRNFQAAKAAVYAAVKTLMAKADLVPRKVFISGAFGSRLKKEWLLELRILPEELFSAEFVFMGNTSLWGGYAFLVSSVIRKKAAEVAKDLEIVYLSNEKLFEDAFLEGLSL